MRYLFRITGNREVAQDLTQETFIKAYKSLMKTKAEINLKPWLYRIATNNVHQYHRRKLLLSFIPLDSLKKNGKHDLEGPPENVDDGIAVKETLLKIPSDQRECLILHHVEGFRYQEIAEMLGISEDAVRMRVARAKKVFRRVYNGGDSNEL